MEYKRKPCPVCGEMVTTMGLGRRAHLDMHIRHGDTPHMEVITGKNPQKPREGIPMDCPDLSCDPDTLTECEECTEARAYHKTLLQPHQQGDSQ